VHIELVINSDAPEALNAIRTGVGALREEGHLVRPHLTFEAGDAERFAREAAARGAELVIAAGGDGTVNGVLNGLLEGPHGGGGRAPRMGIVPLGTANDLASELGIPAEPGAALRLAVRGAPHPVDVASVNGRRFLNVSTGGVGAEVTGDTSDELKRLLGSVAYAITGLRKLVELRPFRARFAAGGETLYEGEFLVFAVGNARQTGGGNRLTPEAELGDGLLDLCVVRGMSQLDFVRIAPDLRAGRHVDDPRVVYRRVPALTVQAEEAMQVNADGEALCGDRFEYRLEPGGLELVLGSAPDA
jgi:diacylglycerol kinase (ATP)